MNRLLAAYWRWFYLRRWRHIDVLRVAVDPTDQKGATNE